MKGSIRVRAAAALVLTFSILASQVMAAPVVPAGERSHLLGELSSFGQVQVNGAEALSGATVFPGSRFTTAKKSGAIINLGAAGRVQLSAETNSTINFAERSLEGALDAGTVTVSKPESVESRFTTKDTEVVPEAGSAAVFSLTVTDGVTTVKSLSGRVQVRANGTTKVLAPGETATAGAQDPQAQNNNNNKKKGGLFWLGAGGFVVIVVGTAIWALTRDDEGTGSRGLAPIIVSPITG